MRYVLIIMLVLGWGLAGAMAQTRVETPGRIGIWTEPAELGNTGNATVPGNFTVDGNLVINNGLRARGTGAPYTNPVPPSNAAATINRLADRLFVGQSANHYNGTSHNLWGMPPCTDPPGSGCSWVGSTSTLTGIYSFLEREAQTLSYSDSGEIGALFATRTSDTVNHGQHCCAEGMASFVYNDATGSGSQVAWGTYNTSVRASGAGSMLGAEFDVANLGNYVEWYPFGGNGPPGVTAPLWVACGGELADTSLAAQMHPCTVAMGILNNRGNTGLGNAPFGKGIVFGNDSLLYDGGIYHAILMPTNAQVEWWGLNPAWETDKSQPSGVLVSFFGSYVTASENGNGLALRDNGAHFTGPQGGTDFLVMRTPVTQFGIGDYVAVQPSAPGNPPRVLAQGSDTDISLSLGGKGGGNVILNQAKLLMHAYTVANLPACGTADTPQGSIYIATDSNVNTFDAPLAGDGVNVMIALCGAGNVWRAH